MIPLASKLLLVYTNDNPSFCPSQLLWRESNFFHWVNSFTQGNHGGWGLLCIIAIFNWHNMIFWVYFLARRKPNLRSWRKLGKCPMSWAAKRPNAETKKVRRHAVSVELWILEGQRKSQWDLLGGPEAWEFNWAGQTWVKRTWVSINWSCAINIPC